MKYHKQTILHDPENGLFGDCFRTCIACLLDLHPLQVPHFCDQWVKDKDIMPEVNKWLALRNLIMFSAAYESDVDTVLNYLKNVNKGVYFMVSGMSERGANHVVIAYEGKIVHDPHPSNAGLLGPCDDNLVWIDVLARRSK